MAKETRTKTNEPVANEDSARGGSVSVEQVGAQVETLTARVDNLLAVVKNISMQIKGITPDNGKSIAADSGSTVPVSDRVIEFEEDIVEEFHSLKQTGSVAEYQDRFVELRDLLMTMNYGLTESYLISSFLSGLKAEIRLLVRKPKPETLYHAFNLARIQEIEMEVEKEKLISSISSNTGENTSRSNSIEVYVTHDHPKKIQSVVGGRVLSTIISTGVGLSFIDTKAAIQAGCKMEEAEPLLVTFVFGCYQAVSKFICRGFKWTIQGHEFVTDVRVVELNACDMVLGFRWFCAYKIELSPNRLVVPKDGKKVALRI